MGVEQKALTGCEKAGLHDVFIERFLAENAGSKRNGWAKDCRHLCYDEAWCDVEFARFETSLGARRLGMSQQELRHFSGVRPDAFILDADQNILVFYECVVWNDICDEKWEKLLNLGMMFDGCGWRLHMIVEAHGRATYELDEIWGFTQVDGEHPLSLDTDTLANNRTPVLSEVVA